MTFETALQNMRASMRASRVVIVDPEKLATDVATVLWRDTDAGESLRVDELAAYIKPVIQKYIDNQHEQLLKD